MMFDASSEPPAYLLRSTCPSRPTKHKTLTTSPEIDQSATDTTASGSTPSIPPPLNVPPSRARRQLAARLAKKKAEAAEKNDPDAADNVAVEAAAKLPEDPGELVVAPDMEAQGESGLEVTGLRTVSGAGEGASRFAGLFVGSDDSDSSGEDPYDEDDAGRDLTIGHDDYEDSTPSGLAPPRRTGTGRRPSTTEAKERTLLDDDDEDDEDLGPELDAKLVLGRGYLRDPPDVRDEGSSGSEEELVEIRTRRTS